MGEETEALEEAVFHLPLLQHHRGDEPRGRALRPSPPTPT